MRFTIAILCCATGVLSGAQPIVSPITKDTVQVPDSVPSYRFMVSGHWYGASTSRSGFPASTVLGNIDRFNATGAAFFLLTGDIFQNTKSDQARYLPSLYDHLDIPLFNAVGNHDLDGGFYPGLFGKTWMQWDVRGDRFIILDTEEDDSSIQGEQLGMIEQAADDAAAGKLRHVFITSHRPVWAESGHYKFLFPGNTKSVTGNNYERDVLPLLKRMAEHVPVHWMAGSMGGTAPASILFETPEPNIHYVMSAIRDETRDAVLLAEVSADSVRWEAISLTGKHIEPVATYTAEWWREHLANPEGFEWRLLPYHIKSTLLHRNFWIGAGGVAGFWLMLGLLRRRRRSG